MAVVNPPGFLQNAGNIHTAEILRAAVNQGIAGRLTTSSLRVRGGVNYELGGALKVQQAGSPNMSVDVLSGVAVIPGSQGSKQGAYSVMNDATTNLVVAAADASNGRIDRVVYRVDDQAYSGGTNTSALAVVTGTPSGSPVAPAAPNNSITLATVLVPALSTSVINSRITDTRFYVAGIGGTIRCLSTARPASTEILEGQQIYEVDTKLSYLWDGTNYMLIPKLWASTLLGSPAASIVFSGIPSTIRTLLVSWVARSDTASAFVSMRMRINGNSGANYSSDLGQHAVNVNNTGETSMQVGNAWAASTAAGLFGQGHIHITGWNDPITKLNANFTYGAPLASGAGGFAGYGSGLFNVDGPYTSITLLPSAGNFIAGTQVTVTALA
jgi:hypothetical protein